MIVVMRGDEELGGSAADLAGRLPDGLAPLARIAYNYRWGWYPGGKDVFRSIDEGRWELCGETRFACFRRCRVRRLRGRLVIARCSRGRRRSRMPLRRT